MEKKMVPEKVTDGKVEKGKPGKLEFIFFLNLFANTAV